MLRFVKACNKVFPTWQGLDEVASTFSKGKARKKVYQIEFDFSMVGAIDMVWIGMFEFSIFKIQFLSFVIRF